MSEPDIEKPDTETRLFSLEEARDTLPLVRPIVEDVMSCHRKLKERMESLWSEQEEEVPNPDTTENETDPDIEQLKSELTDYLDELYGLGAEFQDFDEGWVNFPSMLDDRIVYLCWHPEDEDISHWHETYTECDDRKPIEHQHFTGSD